jgi:hypothetical protein
MTGSADVDMYLYEACCEFLASVSYDVAGRAQERAALARRIKYTDEKVRCTVKYLRNDYVTPYLAAIRNGECAPQGPAPHLSVPSGMTD